MHMKEAIKIKKYPVARYTGNIWANPVGGKQPDSITTCGAISTLMKAGKR